MRKKIIILISNLLKEEEQKCFDFLSAYDVDYEYVPEYLDDNDAFIQRQLRMESEGPDTFSYSESYLEQLRTADVIISFYSPVPSAIFEKGKTKAVLILRSGVENINLKKAREAGVCVMNTPGRLAVPVAEFTVGLILAEMKNIARGHARLMEGEWGGKFSNSDFVYNLKNKYVGIVGCGAVGSYVAEIMKAMHAKILVYDPYIANDVLEEKGYIPVSLEQLCRQADVISIHYRLTEETENLIQEKHFALMKPTAYLINTARAGLVNESALITALKEKRIGGAALDVFHQEPLPKNHPLLKMDNVTLTPHMAGTCTDLMDITIDIAKNCLIHYLETGEWTNIVSG